ncbi:MAG: hypothetical protein KGH54_01060 [Candidatus Micrarchaeota archaeon]|nr:hypothetical protein [Candidatus Micrarchaeota archaeon]
MFLHQNTKAGSKKEELICLFRELRVLHKEPSTVKSAEGVRVSPYYVDVKKAYGDPRVLTLISEIFSKKIGSINSDSSYTPTFVVSSGHNGVPIAAMVAANLGLKFTMVRDRPKNHTDGGYLDGYIPVSGDKAVLIADELVLGGSARKIADAIKPIPVVHHLFVVARSNARIGISQYSILRPVELL